MEQQPSSESVKETRQTQESAAADHPMDGALAALLLKEVSDRIGSLETSLKTQGPTKAQPIAAGVIEIFKAALTGWPAFGLLALALFYQPLRDALNSIPEKVRAAEEINMPGVSLKVAIRQEATKAGQLQIATSLPTLSAGALELLLQIPQDGAGLIMNNPDGSGKYLAVWLPRESLLKPVQELQAAGLVSIKLGQTASESGSPREAPATDVHDYIAALKTQYPGTELTGDRTHSLYRFNSAVPAAQIDHLAYSLTSQGRQSVDVIIKAVASQIRSNP